MTNPDNAVGTNGAFRGRTSVNAFNDVLSSYASRGVISGWGIVPSSGMTLSIGGNGVDRDVAIAADATNNKTTVNNISGVPIEVTLDSAPASNSRYDAIVVYVDKPPISNATQDNPECCGIIPVSGLAASTPAYPDDNTIRSAITADGASGATAYYAILGYVLVAAGTTAITSAMITTMQAPALNASIDGSNLTPNSVTSDKIDWTTLDKVDIITGGITLSSTAETRLPLLSTSISDNVRPATGNGQVFDVSLANNTVTLKKDAAFRAYGGVVPDAHSSGNLKIEVKINGNSVLYARQNMTAYVTLPFHTPVIMGKQGDVITLTVQDGAGNAAFTNGTYGLNWVTFEQIG